MKITNLIEKHSRKGVEVLYKPNYFLRLETTRFITIVDKQTDEYINIYPENDYDKYLIRVLTENLDLHPCCR